MMSSSTPESETSWTQKAQDYWEKMGRINLLNGVVASENLDQVAAENLKNQQAENQWVRKKMWGQSQQEASEDDMRQTVLGDLHTTTNVTQQPSGLGKALLGAGLLAAGVGTSVGGYMVADAIKNKPTPEVEQKEETPVTDTDTDTVIEWVLK